jgi:hypothetical protein
MSVQGKAQILHVKRFRTRITLVIYLGLLQVCMISRKFTLVRDLLADLKSILNSSLLSSETESETVGMLMQKLKTQIQKLKYILQITSKL